MLIVSDVTVVDFVVEIVAEMDVDVDSRLVTPRMVDIAMAVEVEVEVYGRPVTPRMVDMSVAVSEPVVDA